MRFRDRADAAGKLAAALHIDTGINRLGMSDSEVEQLFLEGCRLYCIEQ